VERAFFVIGALAGLLAVGSGAFGAHALRGQLSPDRLEIYETAVRYHFYHALALLMAGYAAARWPGAAASAAGWLFLVGLLLFSGSLYALSLTGVRWLGAITPFGGVAFIVGWLALAWSAWRP
jgi:uncharacterized membrane protein YgdD (TMEM256/DUF423 family)